MDKNYLPLPTPVNESMNASEQKHWLFFLNLNFRISKKNGPETMWISINIYDWHVFDKINPIWGNWIERENLYLAGKPDN